MTIAIEGRSTDLAPSQPRPLPRPKLVAGRFRLIEQLGRGGMGRVFRAHDEVLDRPVAVKLIYDDAVRDRDVQHACALEARAAARLNHPGIVRILDSGFDDGHCYVVMSLADGHTLAEILREDGPLAVDRALDLAIQVADALDAAHREDVIHCDVKPGNLLVDSHWRVRLVDFGIARVTSSTTGLTGELLQGSAQYVAPEQVEGASVDGRTDLYALGTVLYEMLAGRTPFGGGTIASSLARRLVNDPPSVREINPAVPPQVDQVILRALARDPDERFQTAAELRDALLAIRQAIPFYSVPGRRQRSERRLRPWSASAPSSPADSQLSWDRPRQALRAGATRVTGWTARTGLWVRAVAGTVLSDAMMRAELLTPARRPTLRSGIGVAVLAGLLVGVTAAKCSVAGISAEAAIASEPALVTVSRSVPATPTLRAAPPAESVAPVAAEQPPEPVPPAPTATSEPAPAEAEAPAAPPPVAPRPPVRALSAPPGPAAPVGPMPSSPTPPAERPEPKSAEKAEKPDHQDKKNSLSNTPRSDEKTAEERQKLELKRQEAEKRGDPPEEPGAPKIEMKKPEAQPSNSRGNERQKNEKRGNNGDGDKKR